LEQLVSQLKKGRIELRTEPNSPIIHTKIGKVSFTNERLKENFLEILKTVKSSKPQKASPNWLKSCYLASTMGPSVKVNLESPT
ncbi:50S ribosomal protein L1, partial [candidate division WWE3 bacterium]|nr:50S ribosomal protein L1 [candidate division WWE3 bacterium]